MQGVVALVPNYDTASADATIPPDRMTSRRQCTDVSGAAVCTGSGSGQLGLVIAAVDSGGLEDIMAIATPTVPPMTRVPFFNTCDYTDNYLTCMLVRFPIGVLPSDLLASANCSTNW